GQRAAVLDLVIVGFLVIGGGQTGDLFIRLVAVDSAGVLVRLLAARQGKSQRCGCGDDHRRLLPHSHGFLFSSVVLLEVAWRCLQLVASSSVIGSAWWQATREDSTGRGRGSSVVHRRCSPSGRRANSGHRVRKLHPEISSVGLGRSPESSTRSRDRSTCGSGTGIADISARVYGWRGWR